MSIGLLIVSLVLPAGMLDPADGTRLVPDLPLDPFVLFLLPPLLSDQAPLVALAAVAVLGLVICTKMFERESTIFRGI